MNTTLTSPQQVVTALFADPDSLILAFKKSDPSGNAELKCQRIVEGHLLHQLDDNQIICSNQRISFQDSPEHIKLNKDLDSVRAIFDKLKNKTSVSTLLVQSVETARSKIKEIESSISGLNYTLTNVNELIKHIQSIPRAERTEKETKKYPILLQLKAKLVSEAAQRQINLTQIKNTLDNHTPPLKVIWLDIQPRPKPSIWNAFARLA